MRIPKDLILDDNGNALLHGYIAETKMYGTNIYYTLEEAKEFVRREILPKVVFMFYDFNDSQYHAFTIYEPYKVDAYKVAPIAPDPNSFFSIH